MDNNTPSSESHDQTAGSAEPEVLKPREDNAAPAPEAVPPSQGTTPPGVGKRLRRRTYRPSHKATFIGLAAVVLILAINAVILSFVLKSKSKTNNAANGQVTISKAVLSKIGVNSSSIGDSGIVLVIGPNAQFNGKVTVAGDVNIGGQLKLNSTFTASNANLTQLEAGNTALSQLNVNGNSTLSNLNLRNGLIVVGTTQLQGAVTINQLLTVNNNLTVTGNLSVGGVFSARNLSSTGTFTIAGHVITSGTAPAVGSGSALGSNGTVSISGNDASGTIFLGIGANASPGTLANVAFRTQYGSTPRIVISLVGAVGAACSFYVVNPSVGGFSIGDYCSSASGGLPAGGYSVDYIVEQ